MKADDVKEAGEIVDGLTTLALFGKLLPVDSYDSIGMIRLAGPNFDPRQHRATDMPLTKRAAMAALAVLREDWKAREAALRRRAAQIGLVL